MNIVSWPWAWLSYFTIIFLMTNGYDHDNGSVAAVSPPIIYVSFTKSYTKSNNQYDQLTGTKILQTIMAADDSPYEQIDLPWNFNYLGKNVNRVFVNPNGALHMMNATQPACDCFNNNFNTSYFGVIAGYLADFYPGGSYFQNYTNITYSIVNNTELRVSFVNIPFFAYRFATQSFDVSIHRDGHVSLTYLRVIRNQPFSDWISGLRSLYDESYTVYTSEQVSTTRSGGSNLGWITTVPGIYPKKADIVNNKQFIACPISTVWCASPMYINISSEVASAYVSFTPLSLSCIKDIEWVVYLTNATTTTTSSSSLLTSSLLSFSSDSNEIKSCQVIVSNETIHCDLLPLIRRKQQQQQQLKVQLQKEPLYQVNVSFAWRAVSSSSTSTSSYTSLGLTPNTLVLLNESSSSLFSSSSSSYINNCSLNSGYISSNNDNGTTTACQLSPCDLCQRKFDCLGLSCSSGSGSGTTSNNTASSLSDSSYPSSDVLYDRRISCSSSSSGISDSEICPTSATASTATANIVYDNQKNVCCNVSQTDCNGVCYGSAQSSVVQLPLEYTTPFICCTEREVDCFGYCGGTAMRDACGVCNGNNKDGVGCPRQFIDITTSSNSNNDIYADVSYPDYSTSSSSQSPSTLSLSEKNAFINISNYNSSYEVQVIIKLLDTIQYAPDIIFLPPTSTTSNSTSSSSSTSVSSYTKIRSNDGYIYINTTIPGYSYFTLYFQISLAGLIPSVTTTVPSTMKTTAESIVAASTTQLHASSAPTTQQRSQRQSEWRVKTINVNIIRNISTASNYINLNRIISIFPSVTSCNNFSHSSTTCSLLPACIFCYDYTGLRILKEVESEKNIGEIIPNSKVMSDSKFKGDNSNNNKNAYDTEENMTTTINPWYERLKQQKLLQPHSQTSTTTQRRQLFARVVPHAQFDMAVDTTSGVCAQGWLTDSCTGSQSNNNNAKSSATNVLFYSGGSSRFSLSSNIIVNIVIVMVVFIVVVISAMMMTRLGLKKEVKEY